MKFVQKIKSNMRTIVKAIIAMMILGVLAACSNSQGVSNDQQTTNSQLEKYQTSQPVPVNDWSQYRQTVIDVNEAQVHGITTTTFFFAQGINKPIRTCPSIGFPVATTAQLTNPQQLVYTSQTSGEVAQSEPNGVYTGESSGTYVVCVTSSGQTEINYWEGFVETEGGPAHWSNTQAMIVLDGPPTVKSKTKK